MFKKGKTSTVICLLLILVVSFAPVANAASWTTLVPAEHITDTYYVGNYRYVVYDFGRVPYIAYQFDNGYSGSAMGSVSLVPSSESDSNFWFSVFPLGFRATGGPPLTTTASGGIAISVSDFKPSAALSLLSNISLELDINYHSYKENVTETIGVTTSLFFHGYSSSGSYLGNVQRKQVDQIKILQDVQDVPQFTFSLPLDVDIVLSELGENVSYIVPACDVNLVVTEDAPGISWDYVKFVCDSFSMSTRLDMLLQESMTMQEINEKLDATNDKLDQIIQQPENEKQEATDEGGELADQLTGALPDQSQGFMAGIKQLANAMSYEGTDAQLTFPAITLPEISGVMKSYKLSEEMPIDFGFWVQKIPDAILTLVQVVLTLALVVFAFKELYGMISYAMTLKRGEGE